MEMTLNETKETIARLLEQRFPGVLFALRQDKPVYHGPLEDRGCGSLEVLWASGPTREEVQEVVEPFQGIDWDPQTGFLMAADRLAVNPDGILERMTYGVDYIFCSGPLIGAR